MSSSKPPAEGLPQDPAWIVPRACRHEQVIEAVMEHSSVLPVRFGAVFSSRDAVREFVNAHYDPIASFLDWIADKEEWSVKVFVNADKADEWARSSDPALADEWQRLPILPGTRYFLEKRLKAATRRHAHLSSYAAAEEIHWALVARAIEVVRLPLRPDSATENELMLNIALLLSRPEVSELGSLTSELESRFGAQGISLECRGPWPPFHFCPSLDRTPP